MANDLLSDIQSFLAETGMGSSYFGKAACGNSELVERLSTGGRVWPETEDRVRSFMREKRAEVASSDEGENGAGAASCHVESASAIPHAGAAQ